MATKTPSGLLLDEVVVHNPALDIEDSSLGDLDILPFDVLEEQVLFRLNAQTLVALERTSRGLKKAIRDSRAWPNAFNSHFNENMDLDMNPLSAKLQFRRRYTQRLEKIQRDLRISERRKQRNKGVGRINCCRKVVSAYQGLSASIAPAVFFVAFIISLIKKVDGSDTPWLNVFLPGLLLFPMTVLSFTCSSIGVNCDRCVDRCCGDFDRVDASMFGALIRKRNWKAAFVGFIPIVLSEISIYLMYLKMTGIVPELLWTVVFAPFYIAPFFALLWCRCRLQFPAFVVLVGGGPICLQALILALRGDGFIPEDAVFASFTPTWILSSMYIIAGVIGLIALARNESCRTMFGVMGGLIMIWPVLFLSPVFYSLKLYGSVDWTWETCSIPYFVGIAFVLMSSVSLTGLIFENSCSRYYRYTPSAATTQGAFNVGLVP